MGMHFLAGVAAGHVTLVLDRELDIVLAKAYNPFEVICFWS